MVTAQELHRNCIRTA
jgi:hypothetical protein